MSDGEVAGSGHPAALGELQLHDPAVRGDGARVARLLHPDYLEFGASGRVWDHDSIVAALADDPGDAGPAVEDLEVVPLTDGAVLVTYTARRPGSSSRRSSVWLRADDGAWRVRFHQGTPVPPGV